MKRGMLVIDVLIIESTYHIEFNCLGWDLDGEDGVA